MPQIALNYFSVPFNLECESSDELEGRLLLADLERVRLRELNELENESEWYLDKNGERLDPLELFEKSPWEILSFGRRVKVLCRFLDPETGKARFQLPDCYGGEIFEWMRA